MSANRPIFRIKARDVVPGMLDEGEPDLGVARIEYSKPSGDEWGYGAPGWFRECPGDTVVSVQLPGKSPRDVLCTCTHYVQSARSEVPPAGHNPRCPVAPNTDRDKGAVHGGMRLWGRGARAHRAGASWLLTIRARVHRIRPMQLRLVADWSSGYYLTGDAEAILQAFFEPPTIADCEPSPMPTPWDVYDPMELL